MGMNLQRELSRLIIYIMSFDINRFNYLVEGIQTGQMIPQN